MKKVILLLLCTLTYSTYGQTNFFDIGVEGGFSLASIRGSESFANHTTRIGYSGGLFIQYNVKSIFSVRTGGFFERKGSSFQIIERSQNGEPIGTIDGNENFDYLTIPLLLRATFGKNIKYFINAGPYIGLLLKQTEHIDSFQSFPETNKDQTNYFKKTETGLSFGLGLAYTLKNKFGLSFEARNNLGLTNTSAVPVYNNGVIKTNALNFLIGFSYKLGQRELEAK